MKKKPAKKAKSSATVPATAEPSIIIIGREFELTRGGATRGNDSNPKSSLIPVDKLRTELLNITAGIAQAIEDVNAGMKQFSLDEISIKLEVSASGKIGILGNGISSTGTGGITLKFVRSQK